MSFKLGSRTITLCGVAALGAFLLAPPNAVASCAKVNLNSNFGSNDGSSDVSLERFNSGDSGSNGGSLYSHGDIILDRTFINPLSQPGPYTYTPTPEPDTLALLGTGLLGIGFLRRRSSRA
jgi:hypothetical protein